MVTRALAHGLLAGRCELQCVDCASPEEWCCHLHACGDLSDFLVIRVLKAQQFNIQAIKWALLVCFCYVYTMELEQKPRGLTPNLRPLGRSEVRWNTIYCFDGNTLVWSRFWGGDNFFTSLFVWWASRNVKSFLRRISTAIIYRQCRAIDKHLSSAVKFDSRKKCAFSDDDKLHTCYKKTLSKRHELVCFGKAKKISTFHVLKVFRVDWPLQIWKIVFFFHIFRLHPEGCCEIGHEYLNRGFVGVWKTRWFWEFFLFPNHLQLMIRWLQIWIPGQPILCGSLNL